MCTCIHTLRTLCIKFKKKKRKISNCVTQCHYFKFNEPHELDMQTHIYKSIDICKFSQFLQKKRQVKMFMKNIHKQRINYFDELRLCSVHIHRQRRGKKIIYYSSYSNCVNKWNSSALYTICVHRKVFTVSRSTESCATI